MTDDTPQHLKGIAPIVRERFHRAVAGITGEQGVIASTQNFFHTIMPVSQRAVYEQRMKDQPPEQVASRFEMTDRMRAKKPKWDELLTAYDELPVPILPVASDVRLTSTFGERENPFERHRHAHRHTTQSHKGIDLAPAVAGSKVPVVAAMPGVVIEVTPERRSGGFGNLVRVAGLDGRIYEYGHLRNFAVKEGDVVHQGNRIGMMGNTGRSTATHLHYGIIVRSGQDYAYVSPDINGHTLDRSAEGKLRFSASQEIPKMDKDVVRLAMNDSANGHGLAPHTGSREGKAPTRS